MKNPVYVKQLHLQNRLHSCKEASSHRNSRSAPQQQFWARKQGRGAVPAWPPCTPARYSCWRSGAPAPTWPSTRRWWPSTASCTPAGSRNYILQASALWQFWLFQGSLKDRFDKFRRAAHTQTSGFSCQSNSGCTQEYLNESFDSSLDSIIDYMAGVQAQLAQATSRYKTQVHNGYARAGGVTKVIIAS